LRRHLCALVCHRDGDDGPGQQFGPTTLMPTTLMPTTLMDEYDATLAETWLGVPAGDLLPALPTPPAASAFSACNSSAT
jgi:uncharacterized protein (DUF1501 family)